MPFAEVVSLFVVPLEKLGLRYMVTGGVAAIAYGQPRLTNDVDVVLDLRAADVDRLLGAFAGNEFAAPTREAVLDEVARRNGGHANVIHVPSAQKMDLYLIGDDELHAWAMQHRRRERIAGNDVWLAPAEYVVIRKLEWVRMGGSSRHLRDVRDILVHAGPALDPAALRVMVAGRGLEAALEAARNTPD